MLTLPNVALHLSTGADASTDVYKNTFGGGQSQRAPKDINSVTEEWKLVYRDITSSEKDTLRDFFKDHGGYLAFLYTPPEESTARKWITKSGWKYSPTGFNLWNMDVTLEEVFDA